VGNNDNNKSYWKPALVYAVCSVMVNILRPCGCQYTYYRNINTYNNNKKITYSRTFIILLLLYKYTAPARADLLNASNGMTERELLASAGIQYVRIRFVLCRPRDDVACHYFWAHRGIMHRVCVCVCYRCIGVNRIN